MRREVVLPASPAEVWTALTYGERFSEWFGAEVEIDARRGGSARFRFPDGRERGAVVETFEPERLLVLRWLPFERVPLGGTEARPSTNVRFLLEPVDGGTRLVVEESIPSGSPGDRRGLDQVEHGPTPGPLDARVGP